MSLSNAVAVLNKLAEGRPLDDRSELVSAALTLRTAVIGSTNRDLQDAAIGLEALATGGQLDLDDAGRGRAAYMANLVAALDPATQVT